MRLRIIFGAVLVFAIALSSSHLPLTSARRSRDKRATLEGALAIETQKRGEIKGQPLYETIIHVPASAQTLPITDPATPESEPKGPVALAMDESGNFLVTNQADNSVVAFSKEGSVIGKTTFPEASALIGAASRYGRIYTLDAGRGRPQVWSATAGDNDASRIVELSGDSPVTGITSEDGQVAVSTAKNKKLSAYDGASSVSSATDLKVAPAQLFGAEPNSLRVSRGKSLIVNLKTSAPVAEAKLLGTSSSGDFFVYVIQLADPNVLLLDHTVLRFSATGRLLGQARVPATERLYPTPEGTTLAPDGSVYSLLPRADGIDIVRLNFVSSLPTLTKESVQTSGTVAEAASAKRSTSQAETMAATALSVPQVTRQQITQTANWFVSTSPYYNTKNLDGSCPNRVKPRYLGTRAGNYQSGIAYSWGGYDDPNQYQNKLSNNVVAGNAQDNYASCSTAGIDCSGFVARVWGFSNHAFSTGGLPGSGYVRSIAVSSLATGDVLNWAGHHVMMFDRGDSNSLWVWEATTDGAADRTIYHQRTWSQVNAYGYAPYRYNGIVETPPTARITVTSNRGVAYEGTTPSYTVGAGESIAFRLDSSRSTANAGQLVGWTWRINGTVVGSQSAMSFTLGPGSHTVSLEVRNSSGATATASLTIVISQVTIVLQHYVDNISPSYVRRGIGTWLAVYGRNFQPTMRVQVRSPYGGPWVIASSGIYYINSGFVWVYVQMGGSGSYTATLEVVQNGNIASRNFTVGP